MSSYSPWLDRFIHRHSPKVRRPPPEVLADGSLRILSPFQHGPSLSNYIGKFITRRKKALLVGVGYRATYGVQDVRWALPGAHTDVRVVKDWLTQKRGYREQDIVVLSEDMSDPLLHPTKDNIIRELEAFTAGSRPGDHYFFLYTGHSGQREVRSDSIKDDGAKKEEDNMDEYIIPCDAVAIESIVDDDGKKKKMVKIREDMTILDDDLNRLLVERLADTSQLVAVFDNCHSGTLLDLEHHRCNRVTSGYSRGRRFLRSTFEALTEQHEDEADTVFNQLLTKISTRMVKKLNPMSRFCTGLCPRIRAGDGALVICISACKDAENTYETPDGSSLTRIMIDILDSHERTSYKQFMRRVVAELNRLERQAKGKMGKQNPQISSKFPLLMAATFIWI
ncbi:peptidase C14, caspase domain-containing protein [Crucibulum laeve]|uniref:Peptidase C14, caspase domain-containing protein n=1 Tax=Crucibulum laeve TaxID=68775 RepID=A0A5C3MDI0_9AGAR|nr:peptidase C14, caspase domain-containing protein [Crucibulum laeve]